MGSSFGTIIPVFFVVFIMVFLLILLHLRKNVKVNNLIDIKVDRVLFFLVDFIKIIN